jgi:hypothetical protein
LDAVALSTNVSTARYEAFRFRNPALKRFNAYLLKGRSTSLPLPVLQYEVAKQRGFAHVDLMPEVEGHLASFFPPTTLFHNDSNSSRVLKYAVMALKLWPLILHRISLARDDPKVRPLTGKEWRNVLGGEYFKMKWPKVERTGFPEAEDFWRYGGVEFFGQAISDKITGPQRYSPASSFGKMLCGCDPTIEKVQKEPQVLEEVVTGIAQWELMHQLVELAHSSMKSLGLPPTQIGDRTVFIPDFTGADRELKSGVFGLIRKIVLGEHAIPVHGWLEPFSGLEYNNVKSYRAWINALRSYVLSHTDRSEIFSPDRGWLTSGTLQGKNVASLPEDKLDDIAQELISRLFVTAMLGKVWMPEMLPLPERPSARMLKCSEHGAIKLKLSSNYDILPDDDSDFDDEDD